MPTPRLIQLVRDDPAATRAELIAGLTAAQPALSPKYLYDALGSRLFAAITELPEYYPTRTEAAILSRHGAEIAAALGPATTLVDLGAGNGEKAARLFTALQVRRYVAVDISTDYLGEALAQLQARHPGVDMLGVGLDFSHALTLPDELGAGPRTLFYPGSSIGNFSPAEALAFLRQARAACQGGALLVGVDLVKPAALLEPAYDDALGVTAAFNRNLLRHLNRLLDADFDVADWDHVAFYAAAESRIEMHLEARREVVAHWSGGARRFAAGARIHTENSYKWRGDDFAALLRDAGFSRTRRWCDAHEHFAVFVAHV